MDSIRKTLEQLSPAAKAYGVKDLEAALDSFNITEVLKQFPTQNDSEVSPGVNTSVTITEGDFSHFKKISELLSVVLANDEKKTVELNAKVRRKVKRLLEIVVEVIHKNPHLEIKKQQQSVKSNKSQPVEEKEDSDPVTKGDDALVADKDLVALIERVQSSTTASELEDSLAPVKPGIGNTFSRRKLKRLVEQLLKKPEIESSMNAKIRRRVTRVIKILSPNPDAPSSSSAASAQSQSNEDINISKKRKRENLPVPHIAFVGQLPYSCNEEDLRQFFQQHQITGDVKIRLLTDPKTQTFRGMAFVEFATIEDLNQALLLHHATLNNRRINIEKSCGGKDSNKRKEMIEQQKLKQQKTIEYSFQQLFEEYSQKKVLQPQKLGREFKQKLMSSSPFVLSKVLSHYAELPPKERTFARLDQLFTSQVSTAKHSELFEL